MKQAERWHLGTMCRSTLMVLMACAPLLWLTAHSFAADLETRPDTTLTPPAPPLGPRPGPPNLSGPPPVPDPTGHPLGIQCPLGTLWLSGQCVPTGSLTEVTTEKGPPPAIVCPPGKVSLSGECVPIPLPGLPPR